MERLPIPIASEDIQEKVAELTIQVENHIATGRDTSDILTRIELIVAAEYGMPQSK